MQSRFMKFLISGKSNDLLSRVLIKIKITSAIIYFYKNLQMNYQKKKSFCIKYNCYIMKELTFLMELILTKKVHQKSVIVVTTGIF